MQTQLLPPLVSLVILLGCSSPPQEPPATPATTNAEPKEQLDAATVEQKSADRAIVEVSDSIRKACGIPDTEAHFDYNSAALKNKDQPTLQRIAQCFIDGPLAGRRLSLIGHADPRGDEEYNMLLGENRAQNVGKALVSRKLPERQLTTTSRGEMDATGTDESSWALDRKVQLELGD